MKRLPMRKIREALRLRADGLSGRQMALSLSPARATVSEYLRRSDAAGLSWPLPADLGDGDLERLLFPSRVGDLSGSFPQPDWAYTLGKPVGDLQSDCREWLVRAQHAIFCVS